MNSRKTGWYGTADSLWEIPLSVSRDALRGCVQALCAGREKLSITAAEVTSKMLNSMG